MENRKEYLNKYSIGETVAVYGEIVGIRKATTGLIVYEIKMGSEYIKVEESVLNTVF